MSVADELGRLEREIDSKSGFVSTSQRLRRGSSPALKELQNPLFVVL